MSDAIQTAVNWLWAVVLGLVGVVWRNLHVRIETLEARDGDAKRENAAAHVRLYDKIENLRLENKADHAASKAEIVSRLDRLGEEIREARR